MLVIRKRQKPQMAHGRVFTTAELTGAGELVSGLQHASGALSGLSVARMLGPGDVERFVGDYIAEFILSDGFTKFQNRIVALARQSAHRPQTAKITKATGQQISAPATTIGGVGVLMPRYNLLNQQAIRWGLAQSAALVTNIEGKTRDAMNGMVGESLSGQMTITQLEHRLRTVTPLRPDQMRSINNALAAHEGQLRKQGLSEDDIANRSAKLYDTLAHQKLIERTKMISRTELSFANNMGTLISGANGVGNGYMLPDTVKEWSTAEDEKVCPICGPRDGEIVQYDKPFSGGIMVPPQHPNCRCSVNLLPYRDTQKPDFEHLPVKQPYQGYGTDPAENAAAAADRAMVDHSSVVQQFLDACRQRKEKTEDDPWDKVKNDITKMTQDQDYQQRLVILLSDWAAIEETTDLIIGMEVMYEGQLIRISSVSRDSLTLRDQQGQTHVIDAENLWRVSYNKTELYNDYGIDPRERGFSENVE